MVCSRGAAKPTGTVAHIAINDPRISDRMSAGFVGGGGQWLLNLGTDGRIDTWHAAWEVGNREAADRRVWRVVYHRAADGVKSSDPRSPKPDDVIPPLSQALADASSFCQDHGIDGFLQCFRKASACLEANDPFATVYHKDLAPEGILTLSAKRVLAACQAAWVFGGMGSWNDMGFQGEEQVRYEALSNRLFSLLNVGICAGTNEGSGEDSLKPSLGFLSRFLDFRR